MTTIVIGKIIHRVVVLGRSYYSRRDGKIMMGLSIYGVGVISRSLYSRFYGIRSITKDAIVLSVRFAAILKGVFLIIVLFES